MKSLWVWLIGFLTGAIAVSVPLVLPLITELRKVSKEREAWTMQLQKVTKERDAWIRMYGELADEKNVLNVDK